jgi:hypothetical protein
MPDLDPTLDRQRPGEGPPPNIQSIVHATLETLDARQAAWAEAVRQDAVESVARMTYMRKVRHGVRVPVHDMFIVPLARASESLTRKFIEQAAPLVALFLGCSANKLILTGNGCVEELDIPSSQSDIYFSRGWTEPELDFRLRFERDLRGHVSELYRSRVRQHVGRQLESITQSWRQFAESKP